MAEDPGHGRQGRHAVDERRVPEQALARRVRRLLLGLAALVGERLEQDRLLAEHGATANRTDGHRKVVAGAQDITADDARGVSPGDGRLQCGDRGGRLGTDGDDGLRGAHGEGGDGQAFDDRVRAGLHQVAVHDRGRVGLEAVGDHVSDGIHGGRHGPPLVGRGEAAAATPPQAGRAEGGDRRRRTQVADSMPRRCIRRRRVVAVEQRMGPGRRGREDGRHRPNGRCARPGAPR